ncbi:6-bladed beta-propeller [Parabacteroides sp.]|uniref:6-bladed beta-propeller n=1 Tax=Parabacteroides sp. TaxID=1869337 RepID=UPI003080DFAD
MKRSSLAFLLIILFVIVGCKKGSDDRKDSLPVFDMEAVIGRQIPDTFTWNGVAKKIDYVPLSTSSDALFGAAQLVHIDNDFYCMIDPKTSSVFYSDKTGKIIHSFSRKGQGPGEYAWLTYVSMNPKDSTISVFDQKSGKYIIYDLMGNFIKETFLKEKGLNTVHLISDNFAIAKGLDAGGYKLCVTDKDLNIRKNLFPMDTTLTEMERFCMIWQLNYSKNRDMFIANFANEDTVFAVTAKGALPVCVLKKGKYALPEEEAKKPMDIISTPYIRSMWLSAVSDYYLITYLFENQYYDEIWNGRDNKIISRLSCENGEWGFPLCLPSGKKVLLNTRLLYVNGNMVASFIDAATAVEGGVEGVEEDDNPVLVVMEL